MKVRTEKKDEDESNLPKMIQYKISLKTYLTESSLHKILMTYDSLGYVIEVLQEMNLDLGNYTFVIDEFHSIFQDSRSKPGVELNFLDLLQGVPNVIYLSATPIMKSI